MNGVPRTKAELRQVDRALERNKPKRAELPMTVVLPGAGRAPVWWHQVLPHPGVPRKDLDESTKASLALADSALQYESDPIFEAVRPTLATVAALEAETEARETADVELHERIDSEAATREAADVEHDTRLADAERRLDSIDERGLHVGSFDDYASVPQNIVGFAKTVSVNDWVTVRADENHGGLATRYIADAIDAGTGDITWTYDMTYHVDISGKMDIQGDATEDNFVAFDDAGNAKDSGVTATDFATAAQGAKADAALVAADGVAYDSARFGGMTKAEYDAWVLANTSASRINKPNLWPTNGTEQSFGDGVYGRRYTGNISVASGTSHGQALFTQSGIALLNSGGWWHAQNNRVAVGQQIATSTTAISATSAVMLEPAATGAVVFRSMTNVARTNAAYDVWVLYTR